MCAIPEHLRDASCGGTVQIDYLYLYQQGKLTVALQSQTLLTSTLGQSTSPVCTTSPAQYLQPSSLLCCRLDGLELSTGQFPRPSSQQQQVQTTTQDGLVKPLLITLSAVQMLYDSALYKYIIDIVIASELLWCTTTRRQHLLPRSALRNGADAITLSTTVRDLGIFIDADLSMRSHVQRTVAGCFAILRQLRSIQ